MGKRGKQLTPTGNWQVEYKTGRTLANTTINFIQALPTPEGTPFKLLPWQKKFLQAIFATDKKGKRYVRNAVLSLGRKNGKTTLAAGIMLAHLVGCLQIRGGELYSVACDKEQAAIVFKMLESIILQCPTMMAELNIVRHQKKIEHEGSNTVYKALTADAERLHGLNPTLVIYDELAQAKNRVIYDTVVTSFGARQESLLLVTSTQHHDDEHIMSEVYDYANKIKTGKVKDRTYHAEIYTAPPDDDITDPATWRKANPSLGKVRLAAELKTFANQLKNMPQREAAFRNLYLNQRVNIEATPWISREIWDVCADKFTEEDMRGQPCVLGVDAASVLDMSAIAAYFPQSGHILIRAFCPRQTAERPSNTPYKFWANNGLLTISKGIATDFNDIFSAIQELTIKYDVKAIGYDRWRLEHIAEKLADLEITAPVLPVGQGYYAMADAVDETEKLILHNKLKHNNNPLLNWQLQNIRMQTDDAGNRKPSKAKSEDKIDLVVAMLIAIYVRKHAEDTAPLRAEDIVMTF